ncbi:hypothetical protein [Ammoniphilus sp. CFH 90114]|uniref:hypothetical protein n=1 Tax=Ammoniphilus sp. CFH 90114 TaxID=2493665 RepID=UPI00100EF06A|nr:hypothetical protein [Ammoniphilus sp. CFH 90114]RXT14882.1 hypothetical protein EIZ39_01330 [Ammoniphilus sp. CFH 90114]
MKEKNDELKEITQWIKKPSVILMYLILKSIKERDGAVGDTVCMDVTKTKGPTEPSKTDYKWSYVKRILTEIESLGYIESIKQPKKKGRSYYYYLSRQGEKEFENVEKTALKLIEANKEKRKIEQNGNQANQLIESKPSPLKESPFMKRTKEGGVNSNMQVRIIDARKN